jgi:hypothetical protein
MVATETRKTKKPHPASTPHDHATHAYLKNHVTRKRWTNKLYQNALRLPMNSKLVVSSKTDERGKNMMKQRRVARRVINKASMNVLLQGAALCAQKDLRERFNGTALVDYDEPTRALPESSRSRAQNGALQASIAPGAKLKLENFLSSYLQQVYGEALRTLDELDPKMKRARMPQNVLEDAFKFANDDIFGGVNPFATRIICVPRPKKKVASQPHEDDARDQEQEDAA